MPDVFEAARDRLLEKLSTETAHLKRADEYFEAEQPLEFLSPILKTELDGRIKEMVYELPRSAVEIYDHRLDVTGFRFKGRDAADDDLWSSYQENDGEQLSQQVQQEALALGRSYAIVGEGEDAGDGPLITPESPFQCIHEIDPRTKNVATGLKTWKSLDDVDWASVYHPLGRQTWWMSGSGWKFDSREDNEFGISRLVPFINQARTLARQIAGRADRRMGRSVFESVIPIVDAINKMLTDMMVSGEFHAMPRRWAVGLTEKDFTDEHGDPMATWELIAGRIWASENKDVKMGQFKEADLVVFHNTVKLLMQLAAQLLGLPPHYLAFTGDNPASADAIRSSEIQLVKRAERMQSAFGGQWGRVQALSLLTQGYPKTRELRTIETLWNDPSTPTFAQKADGVSKLVTTKDGTGRSIVPVLEARQMMGFSQEAQSRMIGYDGQADPQVAAAMRTLELAGGNA